MTHSENNRLTVPIGPFPPRPRMYRSKHRWPTVLDRVASAVASFGAALNLSGRPTRSPQEGVIGGGVKRAAGAPAPRNTTSPGGPDSAKEGTR